MFCPIAKQQADTLAVVGASDAFGDSRANVDGYELRAGLLMLCLWYGVCDLEVKNNVVSLRISYFETVNTTHTTSCLMGNSSMRLILVSDRRPVTKEGLPNQWCVQTDSNSKGERDPPCEMRA